MSSILPAVFGLVGAILGGLIAAGSAYMIETRREEREQKRERRAQAAVLRQASRLIEEEFSTAIYCIRFAQKEKRWGDASILEPRMTAWQEYRSALALGLPTDVWSNISKGYIAVQQVINLRAVSAPNEANGELVKGTLELAERLRNDVETARKSLGAFTTSEP